MSKIKFQPMFNVDHGNYSHTVTWKFLQRQKVKRVQVIFQLFTFLCRHFDKGGYNLVRVIVTRLTYTFKMVYHTTVVLPNSWAAEPHQPHPPWVNFCW